jgi:hypothetical protein
MPKITLRKIVKAFSPYGLLVLWRVLAPKLKYLLAYSVAKKLLSSLYIADNTVLLLEANDCHADGLPGIAKYLLVLGYNVDVIITNRGSANVFSRFPHEKLKIIILKKEIIGFFLNSKEIKQYTHVFIYSYHLYYYFPGIVGPVPIDMYYKFNIFDIAPICMIHESEYCDTEYLHTNKIVSLVPIKCYNRANPLVVNAHYCGTINQYEKSDITSFIVCGGNDKTRRNYRLLFNACDYLLENNIHNFKIILTGFNKIEIHDKYKENTVVLGYLDWEQLYSQVESSDFLLALIDNSHNEYLNKASGNYLMSYRFLKPILIHQKFSKITGFNESNSIIYENNNVLGYTMMYAIKMSKKEYADIVSGLKILENEIYNNSLKNLEYVLSTGLEKNKSPSGDKM